MSEEKQLPQITDLPTNQQRFIHLYITGQYKIPQIAELLNVTTNTVRLWLTKPEVKEIVSTFQVEEHEMIENKLKDMRLKALNKLCDLIDSPIDGVALSAVKDVLDRSGHKSINKSEKTVTINTFEQQLKDVIDATIIDADYEEEGDN